MSYYFSIIGTKDNPLFSHEFGTSKSGGDGVARFREEARHMNQFILHSSLDIVEEVMWTSGAMYLKSIDRFHNSYISCFLPNAHTTFLLLHNPDPNATAALPFFASPASLSQSVTSSSSTIIDKRASLAGVPGAPGPGSSRIGSSGSGIGANPLSQATEDAVRQFFLDVYENWVKTIMNPFYTVNSEVKSPIFRARVAAAARKYL